MVDNNWITYLEVSVSVFDTSIIYGCSDPTATNYDPIATLDDGSCCYGSLLIYKYILTISVVLMHNIGMGVTG